MRAQYCHIHAAYFSSHLVVPSPRFPLLRDYNRFPTQPGRNWTPWMRRSTKHTVRVSSAGSTLGQPR